MGYNIGRSEVDNMSRAKTINSESRINIRVDSDVKKNAEYIFDRLGLNLSDGINIYLRRVVADNGVPFPLKLVRSETIGREAAAMEATFTNAVRETIERKQRASCGEI
jgi:DNA-damage-inducible protein J